MNGERVNRAVIGVVVAWAASYMAKWIFPLSMPWKGLVLLFVAASPAFAIVLAYGLIVAFLNWTASGSKASLVALAACGHLFGPGGLAFLEVTPTGVPFLLLIAVIGAVTLYKRLTGPKKAPSPKRRR